MDTHFPRNMIDFTKQFSTENACVGYLRDLRWPKGFICPVCNGQKGWLTARGTMFCSSCKHQTSMIAGTIFHRTKMPLRSWFFAMWLACTQKTGLSAVGLQRMLGLGNYRTAWLMLQKLRQAMVRVERDRLHGWVEVDETYIGGKEKGIRGRQLVGKALVVIAVEVDGRKIGRIRLRHVPDGSSKSLVGFITDYVEPSANIHTDGWNSYVRLSQKGYHHKVTHTDGDGELAVDIFQHVHLVASVLKRWLGATHQGKVGQKHLQGYLDEFTFRFNRRRSRHVGKIFHRLAEQMVLRQSKTYQEIIDN